MVRSFLKNYGQEFSKILQFLQSGYNLRFEKHLQTLNCERMNSEIILRIKYLEGQNRLTMRAIDTFGQLMIQIARACNYSLKDLILQTEDNKLLSIPEGRKLHEVPYFRDGAIIKVSTKNPQLKKKESHGIEVSQMQSSIITSKCNHPPGGKCLNCMGASQQAKQGAKGKEQGKDTIPKPKCNHGPEGKCLNCMAPQVDTKEAIMKRMCQHGPNAKCLHCLDKQFISDTAHISFDQYLQDRKLKCKGVHPAEVKCGNCLAPSQIRYQVDKTCKYHEPYPKAMCNKCLPPSVVVKRQQYRHVDYVEFMNVDQLSKFVKYWVQKKHMAEQRVGFLYGYYAEDPHYKNGIRLIIQAIYQPKQKGTYNTFEILETQAQLEKIDKLAEAGLGLEKVGWIYTENNHDVIMSQNKVRMAARYQQAYQVNHSSGYPISNFVTVILRNDQKSNGEVKPEVYMISDQGQALQKYNLFQETQERKMMKVRTPQGPNEALPAFICGGKPATEFEPQFLLVKLAHGSSRSNKFAYLKNSQFPAIHQDGATKKNLKQFLKTNKHKKPWVKYGDFNLLAYLAESIDLGTAINLANCVQNELPVQQHLDDFVTQFAQM